MRTQPPSPTCEGNSPSIASVPPTMRVSNSLGTAPPLAGAGTTSALHAVREEVENYEVK